MNVTGNEKLPCSTLNEAIAKGLEKGKQKALFKTLWYQNELSILFAESNVGKSIYAVQIAEYIAKNKKVMYFDYELSVQQLCNRYANEDRTSVYVFSHNLYRADLTMDVELNFIERFALFKKRVKQAVEQGITVFIIDNLTCLYPGLTNNIRAVDFMLELKRLMNVFNVSFLLLAHCPKRNKCKPVTEDNLAGSKNLVNLSDSCFCLAKAQLKGELLYLKQLKDRNNAKVYTEDNVLLYAIEKENNFLHLTEYGYATEESLLKAEKEDNMAGKMEAYNLYKQGFSFRDIGRRIGRDGKTVKKWVMEYQAALD